MAPVSGLFLRKHVKEVKVMAIILFIYSAALALGVWQEQQNRACH